MAGGAAFDYSPGMTLLRDSLFAALVLVSVPALAAAPRTAAKPPAPVLTPSVTDPVADLIAQAQAAQSRGEKDLALRLAQSAIVANPGRPATYNALGDLYAADGEADFARFYYRQALTIDPMDAAALKAMAALDHEDGQKAAKADTTTP